MLLFMLLDKRQTFLGTVKDNGSHLLECNLKNLKRQAYYHIKRDKNQNFQILKRKSHTAHRPWDHHGQGYNRILSDLV